jgi:hypothetical protein
LLRDYLRDTPPAVIGFTSVPNRRVVNDVKTVKLLAHSNGMATVDEMQDALRSDTEEAANAEDLWALENELDYTMDISWAAAAEDGSFDILLRRRTNETQPFTETCFPASQIQFQRLRDYANNPVAGMFAQQLVPQLRRFLQDQLPEYMVPSAFVQMDALPLTPNGKVNRQLLPPPDQTRPELEAAYVAPRNSIEETLTRIWQELLGLERIGIQDNFFELGGDSILYSQSAPSWSATYRQTVLPISDDWRIGGLRRQLSDDSGGTSRGVRQRSSNARPALVLRTRSFRTTLL